MITVVTGKPGAGKTTYIEAHRSGSDVVLDFDALLVALGNPGKEYDDYPEQVKLAQQLWVEAWSRILSGSIRTVDVWVHHMEPTEWQMDRYNEKGCRVVHLDDSTN